jgi:DnaJ-like protein
MSQWSRYESVVDQQIRMAQERGDFDDLPGKGKPLRGLDGPSDDLWWVREYVRREGLSTDALLPPSLQLRKEIERLPETVEGLRSERAVREVVADLNMRIASWLRTPSGPAVPLRPVVADEVVARWHSGRPATASAPRQGTAPSPDVPATSRVRPGRWRRLVRRRSGSF